MKKLAVLILLAVIAGLYFGYPFFTIQRLIGAIESGDIVVVDSIVDWKSLRENFRADVMREMASKKDLIDTSSSGATAGSMIGMALAGPMMDRMLETYVNGQSLVDFAKKMPSGAADLKDYLHDARFVSPTMFQYSLQDPKAPRAPIPVVMELQGGSWRVVRVVVPSSDELSKALGRK